MTKRTAKTTHQVDRMFRAFSDRTRLRILHLLLGGEMCVADLVAVLRVEQPSASRHLAYLRKAGLVAVRKTGLWKYYSLAIAQAPFHQKLLECLACCFQEVPEIQKDQGRAKKVREQGGCCPDSAAAKPKEAEKSGECCLPS
jgi:ArsR family transcriptional regulator, arsenate/arsenite/antimonite-responsive transcriptional repressor